MPAKKEELTAQGLPVPEHESDGPPSEAEKKKNDEAYHAAFPKSHAAEVAAETSPAAPTDEELAKADKGLPVFDPREETPPGEPFPDTPSGAALMEVGNLNGEEVPADKLIDAGVHGEAYQAAKRKRRWGY